MSLFSAVVSFFRQGTKSFNEFEHALLDRIANLYPIEIAARLRNRINGVTLVQRLGGGQEINCYHTSRGKIVFPPEERMFIEDGESDLAEFKVSLITGHVLTGKAYLVNGYFFSLGFSLPTEHVELADVTSIEVVKCK